MNAPSPEVPVVRAKLSLQRRAKAVFDSLSAMSPRRPGGQDAVPARIGVLLQWGIGDAVLAQPLLQGLRNAFPETSIEVIGKPWLSELFSGETFVDHVHTLVPPWTRYTGKYRLWDKDWRVYMRSVGRLRSTRFDALVALRFDPRENLQLRLLDAQRTYGFGAAGGGRWVTDDLGLTFEMFHAMHRSEVAAHAAWKLTGARTSGVPALHADADTRTHLLAWLTSQGYRSGRLLAVHNGAGASIRRWGWDNMIAAMRPLPGSVRMVVAIDDGSDVPVERLRRSVNVPLAVFHGSLGELKALLSMCDVLLCNDSGVMHIAAAVGCRTVPVIGPTLPLWFGPSGQGHSPVCLEPMPCRPCMDVCVHSAPICMTRIRPDLVTLAMHRAFAHLDARRIGEACGPVRDAGGSGAG